MFELVKQTDLSLKNLSIEDAARYTTDTITDGSVIYADNAAATITATNVDFTNNKTEAGNGGAIANILSKNFQIINSKISKNTASGDGGAVYNTSDNFTLSNITADENISGTRGGAIYTNKNITISNSDFGKTSINRDSNGANDIYIDGAVLTYVSDSENHIKSGIAGNGTFNKQGEGILNLTGSNAGFTGKLAILDGIVKYTKSTDNDTFVSGEVSIAENTELDLNIMSGLSETIRDTSGSGKFVKLGEGLLNVTGNNSNFNGNTEITEGSVQFNADSDEDYYFSSTTKMHNDSTLVFNIAENITKPLKNLESIGSDTVFKKDGDGTVTLTGNNSSFSGKTIINKGTLEFIANSNADKYFAGKTEIGNGKLVFNTDDISVNQTIKNITSTSIDAIFEKNGSGMVTLTGDNSEFSGLTQISGGTLQFNANTNSDKYFAGNTEIGNGKLVYNIDNGVSQEIQNIISTDTNAVFVKAGLGTVTLTGDNSEFSGLTQISGGTLKFNANANSDKYFAGNTEIGNGKLVFNTANDVSQEIHNIISTDANAVFEKTGSGTIILTGDNSNYNGLTQISKGTLLFDAKSNADKYFAGETEIGNGKLVFNTDNGVSQEIQNITSTDTNAVFVKAGLGTVSLTGDNSGFSGLTQISGGTLQFNANTNSDKYFAGNTEIGNGKLVFNTDNGVSQEIQNIISTDANAVFEKAGLGIVSLTGDNSGFSGLTQILGGTLQYNANTNSDKYFAGETEIGNGKLVYNTNNGVSQEIQNITSTDVNAVFEKTGLGTVTLTGDNSGFKGLTQISKGTLQFNANNNSDSFLGGAIKLINDGTLVVDIADSVTQEIGNLVSEGTATTFTKNGAGTLNIKGINSDYNGSVNINNGIMNFVATDTDLFFGNKSIINISGDNSTLNYTANSTDKLNSKNLNLDINNGGTLNYTAAKGTTNINDNFYTSTDKNNNLIFNGIKAGNFKLNTNFTDTTGNIIFNKATVLLGNDVPKSDLTNQVGLIAHTYNFENGSYKINNSILDWADGMVAGDIYHFESLDMTGSSISIDVDLYTESNPDGTPVENGRKPYGDIFYADRGSGIVKISKIFITDDNGEFYGEIGERVKGPILVFDGNNNLKVADKNEVQVLSWATNVYKYSIQSAQTNREADSIEIKPLRLSNSDTLRDLNIYISGNGTNRGFNFIVDEVHKSNLYNIYRDLENTQSGVFSILGLVYDNQKSVISGAFTDLVLSKYDLRLLEEDGNWYYLEQDLETFTDVTDYITETENSYIISKDAFLNGNIEQQNGSMFELVNDDIELNITNISLEDARRYAEDTIKDGSAIYSNNSSASLNLINTDFKNNSVDNGNGGAIANILSKELLLYGSNIENNTSKSNGGAIYNTSSGTTVLQNIIANSNSSLEGRGGAIYTNANMQIIDSDFGTTSLNKDSHGQNDIYIASNGELIFSVSSDKQTSTVKSGIAGDKTSKFIKNGVGTLNLSGVNNEFKGNFVVAEGTVNYEKTSDKESFVSGTLEVNQSAHLIMDIAESLSESIHDVTGKVINNALTAPCITKSGDGTLFVNGDNSGFEGIIDITKGTLEYNGETNNDKYFSGITQVGKNSLLKFNVAENVEQEIGNIISVDSTAQFVKNGDGTAVLSGNNSEFKGSIKINEGTLEYNATNDSDSYINGSTTIGKDSTLKYNIAENITQTVKNLTSVDNSAKFIKNGNGNVVISGDNSAFTGKTEIAEGILAFNAKSSNDKYFAGTTEINKDASLVFNTAKDVTQEVKNIISLDSSAQFIKDGEGTITLTGDNSQFAGLTQITAGTIKFDANANEDKYFAGNTEIINGNLIFNTAKDVVQTVTNLSSNKDSNAKFIKDGLGTVQINGDNSGFNGLTQITDGILQYNPQTSDDKYFNGVTLLENNSKLELNIAENIKNQTIQSLFSETNSTLEKNGEGNITLIGNNSGFKGRTVINEGSITFNSINNDDKYFSGKTNIKEEGTLVINTFKDTPISNISGNGTIEKNGSQTLIIQDNLSAFNGNLNINEGTFAIAAKSVIGQINNGNFANGTGINLQNTSVVDLGNNTFSTNPNPASLEYLYFNNLNLNGDVGLYLDIDLKNIAADRIGAKTVTGNGHLILGQNSLNTVSDTLLDSINVEIATDALAKGNWIQLSEDINPVMGPIQKYNVTYEKGFLSFNRLGGTTPKIDVVNPAVMASPVAAQVGGYLTQLETLNSGFFHMDRYTKYTRNQRFATESSNKYAINGNPEYIAHSQHPETSQAMWVKPYTTFEKVHLQGGINVSNVTYGSLYGGDSNLTHLGNGFKGVISTYVGYNGSHQSYNGISMNHNGGTIGLTGTVYKNNFFSGLTISAGASAGEAYTQYGTDEFATLTAGIASKTGYNFEIAEGKLIIQPSLFLGYVFANTFDYTNAAGVKINSDPLNSIQIVPAISAIGNLKNGWQPYANINMVWNIMDKTNVIANDVRLPQLSVKPYVQYGVGVQKSWSRKFTAYFQTMLRQGGRQGIALTAGLRWILESSDKHEQKVEKSKPTVSEYETTITGKKIVKKISLK